MSQSPTERQDHLYLVCVTLTTDHGRCHSDFPRVVLQVASLYRLHPWGHGPLVHNDNVYRFFCKWTTQYHVEKESVLIQLKLQKFVLRHFITGENLEFMYWNIESSYSAWQSARWGSEIWFNISCLYVHNPVRVIWCLPHCLENMFQMPMLKVQGRLAQVLKTIFHQCVISYIYL